MSETLDQVIIAARSAAVIGGELVRGELANACDTVTERIKNARDVGKMTVGLFFDLEP